MDGVTDAAYRYMQKRYGAPDVTFTEFTHVIGLMRGAGPLFVDQLYSELERPVIGQVYGATPDDFYHAAKIIAALDFDGIDINMGCPAKTVADSGSGAALIRTPELAKEIVRATKRGIQDYFADGQLTGVAANVPDLIESALQRRLAETGLTVAEMAVYTAQRRQDFTVSVKTRIGFHEVIIKDWIQHLTEVGPDWITVHGRTLKQAYSGTADWDAIADAVSTTPIPVIGNGDVITSNDAVRMLTHTNARGVLIGRGSYGNPWLFRQKQAIKDLKPDIQDYEPTKEELFQVMKEHAKLHWDLKGERAFVQMRKNLAWYCKGFEGANDLRMKLVRVNNLEELGTLLQLGIN